MNDPTPAQAQETSASPPVEMSSTTSPIIQSAARWFWWIAGLSLVNTAMSLSGSDTSFVMGLGITAISDALFSDTKLVAFIIAAIAAAFFYFVGLQGTRRKLWAFYLGIIVYALDALIYLAFQDWMPVAFHGLALFFISKGAIALIQERQQKA